MTEAFTNHAVAWILGLFFGALTFLVNKVVNSVMKTQKMKRQQIIDETTEQDNIKKGLLSLLRFRINRMCYSIKVKGFMTSDERFDMNDMYEAYTILGGNGKTKIMVDYILSHYDIKDDHIIPGFEEI